MVQALVEGADEPGEILCSGHGGSVLYGKAPVGFAEHCLGQCARGAVCGQVGAAAAQVLGQGVGVARQQDGDLLAVTGVGRGCGC